MFKLMRLHHARPDKFVVYFLTAVGVKLTGHLIFLGVLIASFRSAVVPDVIYFISLYVAYTMISLFALYRQVTA